jgi:hypothetical protein
MSQRNADSRREAKRQRAGRAEGKKTTDPQMKMVKADEDRKR